MTLKSSDVIHSFSFLVTLYNKVSFVNALTNNQYIFTVY